MRDLRTGMILAFSLYALSACAPAQTVDPRALATSVASTVSALTPVSAPAIGATPTLGAPGADGNVAGKVCFPSSGMPSMTAYFQQLPSGVLVTMPIAQNQGSYVVSLPPGTYQAYAWLQGFSYGGSYSKAVPCGLNTSCTDHTLLEFSVTTGTTTDNIDLCDWYGQPGDVPLPFGVTAPVVAEATPTLTDLTPATPATDTRPGAIEGSLSYPGSTPQLVIVAFNLDTGFWWWLGTGVGWSSYEIADIPPGRYQVVAYAPNGTESAYASGNSVKTVTVSPGATTSGIDLSEWQQAGTFRARPGGINYP